jgi:hypothetical protein
MSAEVVRPAPDFWLGPLPGANGESLKGQRGRPVILLMARSPETSAFRTQMKEIAARFDRLSTRNVLVVAAFEQVPASGFDGVIKSNVPVVVAPKGAEICRLYSLQSKAAIALIGPDGNLDYITSKTLNASRITQIIGNSFEFQHDSKRRPPLSQPAGKDVYGEQKDAPEPAPEENR